jgi:hypothetical protein
VDQLYFTAEDRPLASRLRGAMEKFWGILNPRVYIASNKNKISNKNKTLFVPSALAVRMRTPQNDLGTRMSANIISAIVAETFLYWNFLTDQLLL